MSTTFEPVKRVKTEADCQVFLKTKTAEYINNLMTSCAAAVRGCAVQTSDITNRHTTPAEDVTNDQLASEAAARGASMSKDTPLYPFLNAVLTNVFPVIRGWVRDVPLQDLKQQRFGNKAFRDMSEKLVNEAGALIDTHIIPTLGLDVCTMPKWASSREELKLTVSAELRAYLLDSFGNSSRIDYGSGHELHFFVFLMVGCIYLSDGKLVADHTELPPPMVAGLKDLVLVVFKDYLDLCRMIQSRYCLEPAGSKGVYGLDDYHHLPYIFGASQLEGAEKQKEDPILPKHITDANKVDAHRGRYMYFEMIGWINENKKGPFHEHSTILYNISGIDDWERITRGMFKMHTGEVMGKFVVIQHFLFGKTLPYP